MTGELRLEKLDRPHRARLLAAEQQRQQRDQQTDANPLEERHDERTDEDSGEETAAGAQIRAEVPQQAGEVPEMLSPRLQEFSEGLRPSDSPARPRARRFAGAL